MAHLRPASLIPLAVAVCLSLPSVASAKVGRRSRAAARDFRQGAYVLVSPGMVHIPFADAQAEDLYDIGYLWGIGAGIVRSAGRRSRLRWSLGASFEHAVYNFEFDVTDRCGLFGADCHLRGGMLRAAMQFRIGAGGSRWFAYGLFGPAALLSIVDFDGAWGPFVGDDSDIDPGFGFELAGGLQFRLFRGFVLGFEPGVDVGFLFNDADERGDDVYGIHTVDLEIFAGWYF